MFLIVACEFYDDENTGCKLYLMDIESGNITELVELLYSADNIQFADSGRKVIYETKEVFSYDLVDGSVKELDVNYGYMADSHRSLIFYTDYSDDDRYQIWKYDFATDMKELIVSFGDTAIDYLNITDIEYSLEQITVLLHQWGYPDQIKIYSFTGDSIPFDYECNDYCIAKLLPGGEELILLDRLLDGFVCRYNMVTGRCDTLTNTYECDNFTFSDDRTKIAYSSQSGWNKEVFIINADGSGKQRLTMESSEDCHLPEFIPGTDVIAYYSGYIGWDSDLMSVDPDRNQRIIIRNISSFAVSIDGRSIVYSK